ncbi:uncharacterized protein LOC127803240 isoform X2 [Diospyros lotus]|uniref:uncharacterized protein LOC127803240 isoform X2 n=1 Tax=Diospyros lotus TaxID=55363 RepID=UPI0022506260|nr:uncharacterized protein LOC127803240 isoform X2 [Diospyros lotus]
MKTMFKSQELWDLVEKGFVDPNPAQPNQQLWDTWKKDAKALFLIQSALDDDLFSRIASASTSNQAWEILKKEYLGDKKKVWILLWRSCTDVVQVMVITFRLHKLVWSIWRLALDPLRMA